MAGVMVAASVLTAAEIPFNALRFGWAATSEENWPGMRQALAANPSAFDEVWMSSGTGFPPLDWHVGQARRCAAAASDLRKMGIVPSVEIQTVIGHSDRFLSAQDCRGRTWSTWVGYDGAVAANIACPSDPRLAEYFTKVGEFYAAWHPGSLWIDDDVTLRNRAPVKKPEPTVFGCFCNRCLVEFSRRDGKVWTREALVEGLRRDAALNGRWNDFHVAVMGRLCKTIAAAVHRVSPETVFGYQYGYSGFVGIPQGLHDGSGMPVRLRPGAGAYWDTDSHSQIEKAYQLAELSAKFGFPDWIEARCPEIESCPRTFSCRTAQGVILEAFENLALGMDFLSMFVADSRFGEDVAYYRDRLFPRIAAAHDFLKTYRDKNVGTLPCGFTVEGKTPEKLVACRGVPVVSGRCRSLGVLPDLHQLPVKSPDPTPDTAPGWQTRTMQTATTGALLDYYRLCDKACGGKLPVVFEYPVMAMAVPRVRPDGTLATLAVVNASIDRQEPVAVRLRGVPEGARSAKWHEPETKPLEIPLTRVGGGVKAVLPRLGAWSCGYLSFDDLPAEALPAAQMQAFDDERAEFEKYHRAVTGRAPAADVVRFAVDPSVSTSGRDAYRIQSSDEGVLLTGSNRRSVWYALYDLLARRGGCRWFWDGDVVPHREAIDLSDLDVREESRFEYRAIRYFAHRGLTRFQAEHWGPEDWKREIDWCLKRRLNCLMPRIGMDDTWQKAYPDIVPYPTSETRPDGDLHGFNDRTSFWGLAYRGRLRKQFTDYAFSRGLQIPTDYGTMTHWYSRTPVPFLEKENPPFLPMANNHYGERTGRVWDIFQGDWLERYWHLTEAFIAAGYGRGDLLHTIGLGERRCFADRAKNLQMKRDVLAAINARALRAYPNATLLLAGWDFYGQWTSEEVRGLLPSLDARNTIVWDYAADADVGVDPYLGRPHNFTDWGLVGHFPYTFGIFLAYEQALDIRARYDLIERRFRAAADDPYCKGYIFWPESSHTDTLLLEYFTENAWRPGTTVDVLLPKFCARRYGAQSAAFEGIWRKVLPVSQMLGWSVNWGSDLTGWADAYLSTRTVDEDARALAESEGVLADLSALRPTDDFQRRDIIDLARTELDRRTVFLRTKALAAHNDWRAGRTDADVADRAWADYLAQVRAATELLALHPDYSMCETIDRMGKVEPAFVEDYDRVLLENASCGYCRSHQYELAAGWYLPVAEEIVAEFRHRIAGGDARPVSREEVLRIVDRHKSRLTKQGIGAYRPHGLRTDDDVSRSLREFESCWPVSAVSGAGAADACRSDG